jgi:hypothetical protein
MVKESGRADSPDPTFIVRRDDYGVGHNGIDSDHKRITSFINDA